ncbi:hypothetical protein TVAG_366310 [Trichomonas vaginalis G3]|uniref:Uncharacterized protein n=1 Tax=Trichomonas vaginalis (strain ATCC PRA-98 / G3) TaxID=412133 RepID=A2DHS5_TRIV3|nr:hypothetical protein TVAGG3_0303430 [Trichomonas vaginalis G3]EAY20123.1 hypothetical protein TVAG_366310 [Trichomonas vaginalis G3]KAI5528075.1 hypothetical protein TVAGG3_0303430 [Trichomonas vaginalis G3]|eukprot:XP_001581109.1 hypothetical protein [Trichomonas vaginalis G3]
MNDLSQFQAEADSIIEKIEQNLQSLESNQTKNEIGKVSQLIALFNQIENVIQSIIAQSSIWEMNQRREARNYVTQLRTTITELQTRFAPFQGSKSNTSIGFNENVAGEDINSPLILHEEKVSDENSSEDGNDVNIIEQQSHCINIFRYITSTILLLAMIYVVAELFS